MKNVKIVSIIVFVLCSCVQEEFSKTITFKVDMNGITDVKNVGVRGEFNNWNETFSLKDEDNDGIYEGTIQDKTAYQKMEFKFVNNNSDYELKDLENRVITLKDKNENIVYLSKFDNPKFILKRD